MRTGSRERDKTPLESNGPKEKAPPDVPRGPLAWLPQSPTGTFPVRRQCRLGSLTSIRLGSPPMPDEPSNQLDVTRRRDLHPITKWWPTDRGLSEFHPRFSALSSPASRQTNSQAYETGIETEVRVQAESVTRPSEHSAIAFGLSGNHIHDGADRAAGDADQPRRRGSG